MQPQTKEEYEQYLEDAVPFCPVLGLPDISLHQRPWSVLKIEDRNYSLIAWPGGVWLARYIHDNPDEFAGKKILDVGTGSGILAIAAARVGGIVTAIDFDIRAIWGAPYNAKKNGASFDVVRASSDKFDDFAKFDVIMTADTFYTENFAAAFFETINPHPFTFYAADGSEHTDLHCLRDVLLSTAELISLQKRTTEEIVRSLPTAVKIVSPGLDPLAPTSRIARKDIAAASAPSISRP